jgi:DNA uptake protein ComE-like DNA-binding protein
MKPIILSLALSLLFPLSASAQKTVAKDAKEAVKEAAKKEIPKIAPKKATLSEADQALVAGAKKKADALTDAQRTKAMALINTASVTDVQVVDGFGEVKAKNVVAKRPYKNLEDVIMVDLIGETTFDQLLTWAKGKQKEDAPAAEKKPAEKKPAKKEDKPKAADKPAPAPAKKAK